MACSAKPAAEPPRLKRELAYGLFPQRALVPVEHITRSILVLRGHRVILDHDLAAIYGVTTGRLNEAVKRNARRFPEDFMFRLTAAEHAVLISQFAISTPSRGGRRQLPWAFTEHGAIQRIEKKLTTHDQAIAAMLSAIRQLLNPPAPKRRGIGFTADLSKRS